MNGANQFHLDSTQESRLRPDTEKEQGGPGHLPETVLIVQCGSKSLLTKKIFLNINYL